MKNLEIVGTSHISKESIKIINQKFLDFKPEIIAIELDKKRYYSMLYKKQGKASFNDLFKIGLTGFLFLIIGRYVQKKLGSIVGMEPGSDMKHAIKLAKDNKLLLGLIDRDIEVTLKRLSIKFSFKEKMKLVRDIIFAPFSKKKVSFDLTKIPKKDLIKTLINELKNSYPNIYNVLIDERNKYMAKKLFKLTIIDKKKVLCVIGAGHEEGIKEYLKKLYYNNPTY